MGEVTRELEQRIFSNIKLSSPTATGFHTCLCPVCGDKQWGRSGFKFEPDSIIYNCFRSKCDATCVFKEGEYVGRKFKRLMEAIDVEIPLEALTVNQRAGAAMREELNKELYTRPDFEQVKLMHETGNLSLTIVRSLSEERSRTGPHLEWSARGMTGISYVPETFTSKYDDGFLFRCILNGETIGAVWHSILHAIYRIDPNSCEGMVFAPRGYIPDNPVVVEGIYDALSVPRGIAVLGNHVTKRQAYLLRNKNPVLLPDRTGSKLFEDALTYGWRVSIPEWKEKDANEALVRYGRLAVAKLVHDSTYQDPRQGEAAYRLFHQL